ncbi:MAG: hypothetical protein Q8P67_19430, partial [archaeon]|nr:hypothetical protein [archaeon]
MGNHPSSKGQNAGASGGGGKHSGTGAGPLAGFEPNVVAALRGKHIDLSNQQLTSLSLRTQRRIEELVALIDEVTLDLNHLTTVPPLVFEFRLRVLRVSINRLRFVPPHLHQMAVTLVELDLSHNLLEALPESLGALSQLRTLKLAGNFLRAWPQSLCASLPSLATLDLAGNRLTSLPLDLYLLAALEELCIERNEIAALPPTLCRLPHLRILRAQDNLLAALPDLPPSVRRLNAWSNRLSSLPPSLPSAVLAVLDCYDNALSSLPDQLPASLSTLNCSANAFPSL